jgi:hypothetical protein
MQIASDVSSKIQVHDVVGFKQFFFKGVRISFGVHIPAQIGFRIRDWDDLTLEKTALSVQGWLELIRHANEPIRQNRGGLQSGGIGWRGGSVRLRPSAQGREPN